MPTPGAIADRRVAQGAPLPHTAVSYRAGCRCPACRARHNRDQARYAAGANARNKIEMAALRAFRDEVAAAQRELEQAPAGSPL